MSLNKKLPIPDLLNIEFNDDAEAKNVLAYGKTSGGAFVPLLVDSNGILQLDMEINDLTDVVITSPADNEILAYDSASGKWINQTPTEAGLDSLYLKLDGSNANSNINIGAYDLTATNLTGTNLKIDNIAEKTAGHNIVFDNDVDLGVNDLIFTADDEDNNIWAQGEGSTITYRSDDKTAGIGFYVGVYPDFARFDFLEWDEEFTVKPYIHNEIDLGVSTHRWKDLYLSGDAYIGDTTYSDGEITKAGALKFDVTDSSPSEVSLSVEELEVLPNVFVNVLSSVGNVVDLGAVYDGLYIVSRTGVSPTLNFHDLDTGANARIDYEPATDKLNYRNAGGGHHFHEDIFLSAYNRKIYFGSVNEYSIYGSATDMIINPAEVGTGSLLIGDGTTNYAEIKNDGEINLHGTARVSRDLWIDASGIKAPGAKPATEVSHGTLETSAWQFADAIEANQESVSWRIAPPYDMDRTEEVKIRIGWSSASTGNIKWQLEYRWLAEDEDTTQGAEETLTAVDGASTTTDGLVITDIIGIDAPSSNDASIFFKLTRLSADGQDTISDTAELHGVCFNYISDKLGISI